MYLICTACWFEVNGCRDVFVEVSKSKPVLYIIYVLASFFINFHITLNWNFHSWSFKVNKKNAFTIYNHTWQLYLISIANNSQYVITIYLMYEIQHDVFQHNYCLIKLRMYVPYNWHYLRTININYIQLSNFHTSTFLISKEWSSQVTKGSLLKVADRLLWPV